MWTRIRENRKIAPEVHECPWAIIHNASLERSLWWVRIEDLVVKGACDGGECGEHHHERVHSHVLYECLLCRGEDFLNKELDVPRVVW